MHTLWRMAVLFLVICCAVMVSAQTELSETYLAEDESFTFDYPAGWHIQEFEEGVVNLSNNAEALEKQAIIEGGLLIAFIPPSAVASRAEGGDTSHEILENFLETVSLKTEKPVKIQVEDRVMLRTHTTDLPDETLILGILFEDGALGVIFARSEGDIAAYEETILAIARTFTAYTCTVSVETGTLASLRVGPGFHRTEMGYLPPDQPFTVIGMAAADDDSLWWKLDKNEVLPQSAAAEIWIPQAQVVSQGGCGFVNPADAPPIIPFAPDQETN